MKNFTLSSTEARDAQIVLDRKSNSINTTYCPWGKKNNFPQYIDELLTNSPLANAIVTAMCDYVAGDAIEVKPELLIKLNGNTLPNIKTIVRKIIRDKVMFGGYALLLTYNRNKEIAQIDWLDMMSVRLSKDETTAYINDFWGSGSRQEMKVYTTYDYFNVGKDENNEYQCVYISKGLVRGVYPVPSYIGSLRAIETSVEIEKYHLSGIQNNLSSNAVINIPGADNYTDEEKKEIQDHFRDCFSGSQNAGQFIMSFCSDKDNAVTIERLAEGEDDKRYNDLAANTQKSIFMGFRMQPCLLGYAPEGTGFSQAEYKESFAVYNATVIRPLQQQICNDFRDLFVDKVLSFKPFTLDIADDEDIEETTETSESENQNVTE